MTRFLALLLAALLSASPALAAASFTVGVEITGNAERKIVSYDCGTAEPVTVEYLNAAPNFLALVPIEGQPMLFVNVISASGAKYEAGQYVWWNTGTDATLHDVTEGLDAAPVLSCSERVETP